MRRVAVVGSGGAGKTTFSRSLSERTGLPVIHLDEIYWAPGWVEPTRPDWIETQRRVLTSQMYPGGFIVDGNYRGTLEVRLSLVDTVIVLDLPTRVTLARAVKRAVVHHGEEIQAAGCPERLDVAFLWYIARFRRQCRPQLFETLATFRGAVEILRSATDVARFLNRQHGDAARG